MNLKMLREVFRNHMEGPLEDIELIIRFSKLWRGLSPHQTGVRQGVRAVDWSVSFCGLARSWHSNRSSR